MSTQVITQTQTSKHCHKVLFDVSSLAMVHSLIQTGIHITIDPTCRRACAHFNNTIDYTDFKEKIKYLSLKKASA